MDCWNMVGTQLSTVLQCLSLSAGLLQNAFLMDWVVNRTIRLGCQKLGRRMVDVLYVQPQGHWTSTKIFGIVARLA